MIDTYSGGIPIAGYSFMNYADAQAAFGIAGYVNYIVVYLSDQQTSRATAASIQAVSAVIAVLSGDQLVEFTGREIDSFPYRSSRFFF